MPHVLVVDDSRLAARVIERFLKEKQITTRHVASIAELFGLRGQVSILRELIPELILLDIYMPEMDGLDVLRKLKVRKEVARVPVLILSSTTDEATIEEAMNLGAEGFIQKPVIPEKTLAVLKQICDPQRSPTIHRRLSGDMGSTRVTAKNDSSLSLKVGNLNYLSEIMDGDMESIRQLVISFLENAPDQIEAIRSAIERRDFEQVKRTAHRFKGGVGNFGAPMITDTALELERLGQAGDLKRAGMVMDTLARDAALLMDDLWSWLESTRAEPTS